jgi:drug/metabolite transporter (DMT)-like permease
VVFLACHIVVNSVFSLSTRLTQTRRYDFFLVTGLNYAIALVGALVWAALQPAWRIDGASLGFGAIQGVHYGLAVVGIYFLLVRTGVGVTFILVRLSVIVPTVVSIWAFQEQPSAIRLAGIGLMLGSIPLVARRSDRISAAPREWWYWPLVASLLLIGGIGFTASKAFTELSTLEHRPVYVAMTFAVTVLVAAATFAFRRRLQPDAPRLAALVGDVRSGSTPLERLATPLALAVIMGVANVTQLAFLLAALSEIPGTIVFPVQTSVSVLLVSAAGAIFWKERHGPLTLVGAAMAVAGLVLVSL